MLFHHLFAGYNLEEVTSMEHYVRPEVLASYTEEELVEEAAVCQAYGPVSSGGGN
jgi:hypothetical protein